MWDISELNIYDQSNFLILSIIEHASKNILPYLFKIPE